MPTKKATTSRKTKKAAKRVMRTPQSSPPTYDNMQSFKVYRETPPFLSFHITRQTIYWTVLLLIIVAIQLYILKVQLEIAALTDAILAQ